MTCTDAPQLLLGGKTQRALARATDVTRILLANWFYNACVRAFEGCAKRKYLEHAGALLTADGTDDELIKLEGVLKGVKFSF